jgi:Zn-dependent peptidase ImmA (M78 family)
VRYGFKAQAERISLSARQELGLAPMAPIDPWLYAAAIGVVVLEFSTLGLDQKHCHQLLDADSDSWSGLTLKEGQVHFIVVNPTHPRGRQANTLVHELAHIQLNHLPGRVDISDSGLMLLSDYPDDQEQEADWLAAAILLPRDGIFKYRSQGWTAELIAREYGVSMQLVEWRLRMTGVETQIKRSTQFGMR